MSLVVVFGQRGLSSKAELQIERDRLLVRSLDLESDLCEDEGKKKVSSSPAVLRTHANKSIQIHTHTHTRLKYAQT